MQALDIDAEIRPPYPPDALGEVRPHRSRQVRGWTPERLAEALRGGGFDGSARTIRRGCADGSIPCITTAGGHRRIDPAWVAEMYPTLVNHSARVCAE